jgi:hypothetical protein
MAMLKGEISERMDEWTIYDDDMRKKIGKEHLVFCITQSQAGRHS